MSLVRNPLTVDVGCGHSTRFTWRDGYSVVEIVFLDADRRTTKRVRGAWRREAVARADRDVREAVFSARQTGLAPAWHTGPTQIREAGRKHRLREA